MKKVIYKDDVYFYKLVDENRAKIKIYKERSGFFSNFFKYKLILSENYYASDFVSDSDVIKSAFRKYEKENKVLLIDCSPEVEELFNR